MSCSSCVILSHKKLKNVAHSIFVHCIMQIGTSLPKHLMAIPSPDLHSWTNTQIHKQEKEKVENRRRFPPKTDDICASAEMLSGVVTLSITFARAHCSLKIGRQTQSRSKVNERGVNKNINIFIIHFLHTPQNSLLARDESRPKKKRREVQPQNGDREKWSAQLHGRTQCHRRRTIGCCRCFCQRPLRSPSSTRNGWQQLAAVSPSCGKSGTRNRQQPTGSWVLSDVKGLHNVNKLKISFFFNLHELSEIFFHRN